MKGIYQRGNRLWIRYSDGHGKMVCESTGSMNKREAEKLLIQRKASVQNGGDIPVTGKLTFKEVCNKYLSACKGTRSCMTKLYALRLVCRSIGNMPVKSLNLRTFEQLQAQLSEGHSKATVRQYMTYVKHVLKKGYDYGMVSEGILKACKKVPSPKVQNARTRFLSLQEIERLTSACAGEVKDVVVCLLNTGMRVNELLTLRQGDCDYQHGFMEIRQTKNGESRRVPMNDTVRSILHSRRSLSMDDPVFSLSYHRFRHGFLSACRKAGIKDFRIHDCRHTFASHLVMDGCSLHTIGMLLGHRDMKMTMRYSHLSREHLQASLKTLYKNCTMDLQAIESKG